MLFACVTHLKVSFGSAVLLSDLCVEIPSILDLEQIIAEVTAVYTHSRVPMYTYMHI